MAFIIPDVVSLLTADAISLFAGTVNAPWGIYLGLIPVVAAENVATFAYRQSYDIGEFPIEGGDFQSYNKVYQPFEARIRFTRGGSLIQRQGLLASIAAIIGDLNLYNVVTADAVYQSVNLVDYEYQQSAGSGLGLLIVDITVKQVKVAPSAALSNPASPGSAAQVNNGIVLPIPALPSQLSSLSSIIGGF